VSNPELSYPGLDILQALSRATNYNAVLLNLVLRSARGRRRMLDFGAGIGTFSKLLRRKGMDVVCVEPDVYLSDALTREGFPTFRDLDHVPDSSFEFIFTLNARMESVSGRIFSQGSIKTG
jgi:Methyltransferase domain